MNGEGPLYNMTVVTIVYGPLYTLIDVINWDYFRDSPLYSLTVAMNLYIRLYTLTAVWFEKVPYNYQ